MRIFVLTAGCAAIGFFVLSCDNYIPETAGPGAHKDSAIALVDNFCEAFLTPFCEAESACCPMPRRGFGSIDDCKNGTAPSSNLPITFCWWPEERELFAAGLRAGSMVFDQAQFDTCLARLKTLSAGGAACTEPPPSVLYYTCIAAFRGQLAPGDACSSVRMWPENNTFQCKDGVCANGKCLPFLKAGDACSTRPETADWTKNHYCNFLAKEWCHGVIAPVESKPEDNRGTCTPSGKIGDACDPSNQNECESGTCDATGTCAFPDTIDGVCRGYHPY